MHWEVWQIWIAGGLILLVLEVFVPGFVLACLGLGSFGGAIAAYFELGFEWEITIAGLTSLLAFLFLRPFALKLGFNGNERLSGVEALIGQECTITKAFNPQTGLGRCKIDGDDWRAKLVDREQAKSLAPGSVVWIHRVDSNTLIVSLHPQTTTP